MDQNLFNSLLHQTESETLDFKRDQYPFENADKDTKSELVKDILAFANAWKNTDAHILIGVEERTGNKAHVVGVHTPLDDAKLQQLINSKTNKPVKFICSTFNYQGIQVGVITIDANQSRPLFLKKNFGKLKEGEVRIRRGSSTAIASPDEIADMGAVGASITIPSIEFEFANPKIHKRLGDEIAVTSTILIDSPPPSDEQVAKMLAKAPEVDLSPKWNPFPNITPESLNPFYKSPPSPEEFRKYHQLIALHSPIGFWVKNTGSVTANDVRIEIRGDRINGFCHIDEQELENNEPQADLLVQRMPALGNEWVTVTNHGKEWLVTINVGKLQPKADSWIDGIWNVGATIPLQLNAVAKIFADNVPDPITKSLIINISTKERIYDVEEFVGG